MLNLVTSALLLSGSSTLAAPASFNCAVRKFGLTYAQQFSASALEGRMNQISDALQMESFCGESTTFEPRKTRPEFSLPLVSPAIFVDPLTGDDSTSGSRRAPVRTLARAVELSRGLKGHLKYIILRGGTHYVDGTLHLTPADSGLVIQSYKSEEAWISGGKLIKADWQAYSSSEGVYVADLSGQGFSEILGLRVNSQRGVRARYPNGDPETMGMHTNPTGWVSYAESWLSPKASDDSVTVIVPHLKDDTVSMYQKYTVGFGGRCSNFEPNVSYWCSSGAEGGGAFTYRVPSGFVYTDGTFKHDWAKPQTGVVQVWREYHWASWMFEIESVNTTTREVHFGKGGFQGSRGADHGAEYFVENIFEELDNPNEWFFDVDTQKLYYYYNTSIGVPLSELKFEATQSKVLLDILGTQAEPVRDITIRGVGFKDSSYTYLDPHGIPSGGDWALQRTAAVFVQGAENVHFDWDTFSRLDGNALMFSGYNRGQVVSNSEFVWIGDSAIAQWGYTDEFSEGGTIGYDGVNNVEQPRGTVIENNFMHEVGIFEKQSSFYFQAKSCQNIIRNNIMFNGPRAGINFNDGFGGGNVIENNFIFNTCRESGDHGPFNSWDRQPFLTTVRDGTPSFTPAFNEIRHNFLIGNYQTQAAVDNDDGSNYYHTHHNFLVYGEWGQKTDFDGHDNIHNNNVYAYVTSLCSFVGGNVLAGHNAYYTDNYCVSTGNYLQYDCNVADDTKPIGYLNRIFTTTGNTTICGEYFGAYQAAGHEKGSTIATLPSDEEILSAAKLVLFNFWGPHAETQ